MQSPSAEPARIYFNGGQFVKHRLPNSPLMCVVGPQKLKNNSTGDSILNGIRCQWFTESGALQDQLFNSKDLRHATELEILHAGLNANL